MSRPISPGLCQHTPGNSGTECRAAAGACDVAETCTGSTSGCPIDLKQPNGTSCADPDVCNGNETCQSGTCLAGTPIPAPGEISNVQFDADGFTMTWDPIEAAIPGTTYGVVRGFVHQLPIGAGAGETCLGPDMAAPQAMDTTVPLEGETYWYLVRGRHACGTGTYGYGMENGAPTNERITAACP